MRPILASSIAALLTSTILATASQPPAAAGGTLAAGFAEVDRQLAEYAAQAHAPGAAWGVIVDGRLAHTGVTGYRDVAARAPVDADTVFRIASMTKSFTAMSILRLRDEGRLSLDDEAERYVPELKGLKYPTTTRRRSPCATCCRTRRDFRKTTRGAIGSSPTPTSSCRR